MWFKVSLIVFAVAVSGCVTALTDNLPDVKPQHDISTGSDTAIIRGSEKGVMEPQTCHIYEPASTMMLVTDAGKVSLLAKCFGYGTYGRSGAVYAGVEFTAEAGHTYLLGHQFGTSYRTIDLIDVSDGKRVVLQRPLFSERVDAANSISKAVVISGSGPDRIPCNFIPAAGPVEGIHIYAYRQNYSPIPDFYKDVYTKLLLTPGEVTFTARCLEIRKRFGASHRKVRQAYEADVSFEAKVGHLYKIDIDKKNPECVQVIEVSRDEQPITCEPARQIDELLGRTTIEICAGPKKRCSEMTSCDEAKSYLRCGLVGLDRDSDGRPCDSLCKR